MTTAYSHEFIEGLRALLADPRPNRQDWAGWLISMLPNYDPPERGSTEEIEALYTLYLLTVEYGEGWREWGEVETEAASILESIGMGTWTGSSAITSRWER